MLKEFRQPDRKHDDSFDLEENEERDGAESARKPSPGKRSMAKSLDEILHVLADSGLAQEDRERQAAAFLMEHRSSGHHLESSIAADFGQRLGIDLAGVRVHTDATTSAITHALGVTAFTFGRDIFFAAGAYQPQSRKGRHVIAHEVAHVAQHRGSAPRSARELVVGREGDRHEREADHAAAQLLRGGRAKVSAARPGVRFMKQAFGELDEPIVAEGAAGLGCSAEELEEIQRQVQGASPDKLAQMLDGASQKQKNIIFFCIGRSDMAQDDATKAFLRDHDNPKPRDHIEVHGVNEAQRAADTASVQSQSEQSTIGIQPDEAPKIATVSARSSASALAAGTEAQYDRGEVVVEGVTPLADTEQRSIAEQLGVHELWLAMTGDTKGLAANLTASDTDVGGDAALTLLKRVGSFSGISQAIAGAQSLYGLMQKDWDKTWEQLSTFGEGATEYERLGNNIATVTQGVDLMLGVVRSLAGGLGLAAGNLWLAGLQAPGGEAQVAATLTNVASGVTTAAGVLGMIRNSILVPAETTFRALDRTQKFADPTVVEQASEVLAQGAEGLFGMVGGLATTATGGGPDDASGIARAGSASQADVATASPADLPLQDVSIQGYESSRGEAADVESDAVGIAVRDKSRDPDKAEPQSGKKLAATEAADNMEGKGKPSVTPTALDKDVDQAEASDQVAHASSVAGPQTSEHHVDRPGGSAASARAASNLVPPRLELEANGLGAPADGTRPLDAEVGGESRERLDHYAEGIEEQGPGDAEVRAQGPSSTSSGRENPPTTLSYLQKVYQTLTFLVEQRRRASGAKSSDLSGSSKETVERGLQVKQDADRRRDVHRGQQQRLGQINALVRQFKSERSRGDSAVATMASIADAVQVLGPAQGRLGQTVANRKGEVDRIQRAWDFVCAQMAGQEQEMHAADARQVTEARRLEAASDGADKTNAHLGQVSEAMKTSQSVETGGSAEVGALDREIARHREVYSRLSGQLVAWAERQRTSS